MNPVSAMLVIGTRPEAIKMAPLAIECHKRAADIKTTICISGQHRQMLAGVLEYFGVRADRELAVMAAGQSLAALAGRCLTELDVAIGQLRPDCVIAQGDTTTVMCAALAAFFHRIAFVHVEAGLRTGDLHAPWPEELNRRVATLAASLHCAPTRQAADRLRNEGVSPADIHVTGNTVVDALQWTLTRERARSSQWSEKFAFLGERPLVLITGHRRENFGQGLANLCEAISRLATRFPDVAFVYPVHLNPEVHSAVHARLAGRDNVRLLPPLPYPEFVWLMDRARVIVTDSGGIQEEAPTLGKPVLVTRAMTERPEGLGNAIELVGTDVARIIARVAAHLAASEPTLQPGTNPYGDGHAAARIAELIASRAWERTELNRSRAAS
ncbi:MAG TPA: UDP-N-acetylglucosamine 2-epimerase (non-hydrolyzing) [Pirellulales bacterium]|nr:UDP-N-acetylglucosamine 2-epimerase (non-hydrolyzing) [Pirellulales bacterium]